VTVTVLNPPFHFEVGSCETWPGQKKEDARHPPPTPFYYSRSCFTPTSVVRRRRMMRQDPGVASIESDARRLFARWCMHRVVSCCSYCSRTVNCSHELHLADVHRNTLETIVTVSCSVDRPLLCHPRLGAATMRSLPAPSRPNFHSSSTSRLTKTRSYAYMGHPASFSTLQYTTSGRSTPWTTARSGRTALPSRVQKPTATRFTQRPESLLVSQR